MNFFKNILAIWARPKRQGLAFLACMPFSVLQPCIPYKIIHLSYMYFMFMYTKSN